MHNIYHRINCDTVQLGSGLPEMLCGKQVPPKTLVRMSDLYWAEITYDSVLSTQCETCEQVFQRKNYLRQAACGWYILIRAHDHVWRDHRAAQLLWELSIQLAKDKAHDIHLRH